MRKTVFMLSMVFLVAVTAQAMDVKLTSGDLKFLKGQTVLAVKYVYDGMKVSDLSEEEFVKKKVEDYNKKSPGKGDTWKKMWVNNRPVYYEAKFEELMNKYLKDAKASINPQSKDAKYTLIVKTTFASLGYNVWVAARPSYVDVEVTITETAKPETSLAVITLTKCPGTGAMGPDMYEWDRLKESYAKCGKELAKLLVKKGFK